MGKIVGSITRTLIDKAQNYKDYRAMLDELIGQRKTTGENQSEAMLHYADMNIRRMNRWDKKTKITPAIQKAIESIDRKVILLTITEGWCGDAAQIAPVLEHLAALNAHLDHRLILRDEHLDVMDEFLTNGGRSIPKTIFLDAETLEVLGDRGPKPKEMLNKLYTAKAAEDFDYASFSQDLHKWYAKDKGQKIQSEFTEALKEALEMEVAVDYKK
jgi:thioredoxin-like negative regulator of GroEL